jgi:hypothetical protein
VIFRSVQFIDGSPFRPVKLSLCDIECGDDKFVVENEFLIDIYSQKMIRHFSDITIPFLWRLISDES